MTTKQEELGGIGWEYTTMEICDSLLQMFSLNMSQNNSDIAEFWVQLKHSKQLVANIAHVYIMANM